MPRRDLDAEAADASRRKEAGEFATAAAAELEAMSTAFDALYQLPRNSRCRALKWLEACLDNAPYYGEPPF